MNDYPDITTDEEYEAALKKVAPLFDKPELTDEELEEFEDLIISIVKYEGLKYGHLFSDPQESSDTP